jgi:hypothetical protein
MLPSIASPARERDTAMQTYLVAYDVAQVKAVKHAVATELMRIGSLWARPLETTWYLRTDLSGADIEARLMWLLDTDDGLLIQPVQDAATLCNTALRWFQQRRDDGYTENPNRAGNVVAFPSVMPVYEEAAVAA